MTTLASVWIALGASSARAANPEGCAAGTTNEVVTVSLEAAVGAYGQLEFEQFESKMDEAVAAARCLAEPITRTNAAELHRGLGLLGFVKRDEDGSRKQFAAARALEPAYTFPVSLVPEGHPLLGFYTALDPASLPVAALDAPSKGSLRVDGSAVAKRAEGLPVLVQWMDDSGAVRQNVLLQPGDASPSFGDPAVAEKPPREPKDRSGPRLVPLIGAGAAVVGSGVLLGLGAQARSEYMGLCTESGGEPVCEAEVLGDLDDLYAKNHRMVISGAAVGAVGVGLAAVSVVGRF